MKITLMSSINLKKFKGAKLMDNESKMEEILNRVMKLEMTQSKHELEIETLKTNVSELIKNSNNANLSIQKILMILESQKNDLEEIKATIKDITSTPKRRYETVIGAIITTLVGGIIGYCLVKLNLK